MNGDEHWDDTGDEKEFGEALKRRLEEARVNMVETEKEYWTRWGDLDKEEIWINPDDTGISHGERLSIGVEYQDKRPAVCLCTISNG